MTPALCNPALQEGQDVTPALCSPALQEGPGVTPALCSPALQDPMAPTGHSRKTCRKGAMCAGLQPPEAGLPAEPSLAVPLPRFEFVPLAGSSLQSEVGGLSWQRASPPQLSDPTTHPPEPPPQTGL